MKDETRKFLDKAARAIHAAETLLREAVGGQRDGLARVNAALKEVGHHAH